MAYSEHLAERRNGLILEWQGNVHDWVVESWVDLPPLLAREEGALNENADERNKEDEEAADDERRSVGVRLLDSEGYGGQDVAEAGECARDFGEQSRNAIEDGRGGGFDGDSD